MMSEIEMGLRIESSRMFYRDNVEWGWRPMPEVIFYDDMTIEYDGKRYQLIADEDSRMIVAEPIQGDGSYGTDANDLPDLPDLSELLGNIGAGVIS